MEREVAQAGSALGLGPRGRRFESCLPDKKVSSNTDFFYAPTTTGLPKATISNDTSDLDKNKVKKSNTILVNYTGLLGKYGIIIE